MTKISEYIKTLAKNGDEIYAKVGVVESVDTEKRTCEVSPIDGSAKIFDVRLQADINGDKGLLIVPAQGSHVVVNFINKNAAFVALTYDIDYIYMRGDALGGLIKIEELVKRLNAIEEAFNNHISKYNLHKHAGVTTGTGTSLIPVDQDTKTLSETERKQLENTKVKHG